MLFGKNFDRQNGDYLVTKLTCDCPPPILTILGNSDSATFYLQMELIDLILHLHNLLCNGAWLNAGSNENVPNSLEKHKFYNNNLFLWEYFYGSIQCLFWHKWLLCCFCLWNGSFGWFLQHYGELALVRKLWKSSFFEEVVSHFYLSDDDFDHWYWQVLSSLKLLQQYLRIFQQWLGQLT